MSMRQRILLENRWNSFRKSMKKFFWVVVFAIFSTPAIFGQFVHTNGTKIVDSNGNDLYFTGMNMGNWLVWEGYLMMGDYNYRTHTQFFNSVKQAFGGDLNKAIDFEHQWRINYVTEKAINELKGLGFNSVRVPFHFNLFWDYNTNSVSDRGFQYLDRLVQFCKTNGVYILLDMHAAPGYQNPGDHCDNGESNSSQPRGTVHFWDGNNVNIASQVWRHIANHYKNEPMIWGYDLLNEPVPQPGREYELLRSMVTMRNAIREVDNNHIIVAEGSWWSSELDKLDWTNGQVQSTSGVNSRWDNNIVYQTHHYSSDVSALNGRKDICNKLNVPMILGEYGESDMGNLRNMTNWCLSNDVDYFPWSFKKMSHDKCLWTINPNDAYNTLKNAINSNSTGPGNLYNDMISFCQNNIANGSAGLSWHQDFYDAVKNPNINNNNNNNNNNNTGGVTGLGGTYLLENRNSGMVMDVANGNPANGTNILQWNNTGNPNQQFKLNEVSPGIYSMICVLTAKGVDVAGVSNDNGANIQQWEYAGGANQKFKAEDAGGGYYKFRATHSNKIIEVGNASLAADGNINQWDDNGQACGQWKLLNVGNNNNNNTGSSLQIEAESYFQSAGVQTENCSEGGLNVGWLDKGDYMVYGVNIPASGTFTAEYRVASLNGGGSLKLESFGGATSFGTISIPSTGGWQNWSTVSHTVTLNAGQQNIAIAITNGGFNINWIKITQGTLKSGQVDNVSNSLETIQVEKKSLDVYPNPASNVVYVSGLIEDAQIEVYSIAGSKLCKNYGTSINISNLVSGTYIIRVTQLGNVSQFKFLKK